MKLQRMGGLLQRFYLIVNSVKAAVHDESYSDSDSRLRGLM
jgi:hypothetical protein